MATIIEKQGSNKPPPTHALHMCPDCGTRAMAKEVAAGAIQFRCPCGTTAPGTKHDRLIASSQTEFRREGRNQAQHDEVESFDTLLQGAARGRTGLKVPRECKCGLPYMTRVQVGTNETVVHVCDCGHRE